MTAHVIAPRQQAHGPRPRERRDGHITLILGFEPSVSSFLWFPIPRVRVMSAGRSFQSWAHPCPTCEAGGPCPTCEAPSHPWAHLSSPGGPFQPWAHPCQAPPGGPSQPWAHPSQAPGSPFEMRRTTARDDRSPGGPSQLRRSLADRSPRSTPEQSPGESSQPRRSLVNRVEPRRPPIRSKHPLDYDDDEQCKCDPPRKAGLYVSWKHFPGRRFYGCFSVSFCHRPRLEIMCGFAALLPVLVPGVVPQSLKVCIPAWYTYVQPLVAFLVIEMNIVVLYTFEKGTMECHDV